MTPKEAFELWSALKLHFTTDSYDAFKYNFKTKASYEKQPRKFYFNKLAKHSSPQNLVLANLSRDPKLWVGKLFEPKAQDVYWAWKKYQESQTYLFKEEINQLDNFAFTAMVGSNEHPPVLQMFLRKKLCLDTLTIANDFFRMIPAWDQAGLIDDPMWYIVRRQILKYRPFIDYNKHLITTVLKEKFLTYR